MTNPTILDQVAGVKGVTCKTESTAETPASTVVDTIPYITIQALIGARRVLLAWKGTLAVVGDLEVGFYEATIKGDDVTVVQSHRLDGKPDKASIPALRWVAFSAVTRLPLLLALALPLFPAARTYSDPHAAISLRQSGVQADRSAARQPGRLRARARAT
jgi:hypothetical protein